MCRRLQGLPEALSAVIPKGALGGLSGYHEVGSLKSKLWRGFESDFAGDESDEENRLVSVTKGTHRSEFVYDGLGRRVQILEKEIAPDQSATTSSDRKFLWAGTEIAEERSGDNGGTVQKRFFA